MAIIYYFNRVDRKQEGTKTFRDALEATKYKQTWLLSLFYFLTFGVFVAFGIYLPTLLQDLFSLTATDAGGRETGFIVLANSVRPIDGLIADKLDPKNLITYVFTGITISAILLVSFNSSIILYTVFCLAIAFFSGLSNENTSN